ncbi:MAG: hypothetical protein QQN63_04475 [Nitrosopumilus sp.]
MSRAGGNLIKEGYLGPGATSGDFFLQTAFDEIPDTRTFILGACNTNINTTEQTIWEQGGIYPYLIVSTELFVTSTNVNDIDQVISVQGLRAPQGPIEVSLLLTDGQTPVSAGNWFRIFSIRNFGLIAGGAGRDLVGSLYLAQAGAWTAGVPDTVSDIKGSILFSTSLGRSPNIFNFPGFTPPIDTKALITKISFAAPKGQDINFSTLIRTNQEEIIAPFHDTNPFNLYQSVTTLNFHGLFVGEDWDIEIRAKTSAGTASVTVIIQGILVNQ